MTKTTAPAIIGNHLRRVRFEHGELSQDALARRLGITRQTIIAIEGGRYTPSLELAMCIAREFNRGVDAVFFWTTPPTGASTTTSLSTDQ